MLIRYFPTYLLFLFQLYLQDVYCSSEDLLTVPSVSMPITRYKYFAIGHKTLLLLLFLHSSISTMLFHANLATPGIILQNLRYYEFRKFPCALFTSSFIHLATHVCCLESSRSCQVVLPATTKSYSLLLSPSALSCNHRFISCWFEIHLWPFLNPPHDLNRNILVLFRLQFESPSKVTRSLASYTPLISNGEAAQSSSKGNPGTDVLIAGAFRLASLIQSMISSTKIFN
jgi:hypothetical protein